MLFPAPVFITDTMFCSIVNAASTVSLWSFDRQVAEGLSSAVLIVSRATSSISPTFSSSTIPSILGSSSNGRYMLSKSSSEASSNATGMELGSEGLIGAESSKKKSSGPDSSLEMFIGTESTVDELTGKESKDGALTAVGTL